MASTPATPDPCRRLEARLLDLADPGEGNEAITRSEQLELLRHAEVCARCGPELQSYRATVRLIRSLPRQPAPPGFLAWVRRDAGGARSRAALNGDPPS